MVLEVWEDFMLNIEQEKEGVVIEDLNYEFFNLDNLLNDVLEINLCYLLFNKLFILIKILILLDIDFYKLIKFLNFKQRFLFDFIYYWVIVMRLFVNVFDLFYIFLSGGGDVGKFYLINVIYEGVIRVLCIFVYSFD